MSTKVVKRKPFPGSTYRFSHDGLKTIRKPQCGSHYCWLFAVACLTDPDVAKRLTSTELEILIDAKKRRIYPPAHIVRKAFLRPYLTLKENGIPCTVEGMKKYWHTMHNLKGEFTPVYTGAIIQIGTYCGSDIVHVSIPSKTSMYVENVHGYKLAQVKEVYVHGHIIAGPAS